MKQLRPGDLVDHFSIIEKFDHDGMGDVYLAQDLMLSRQVVLKFHKEDSEQKKINLHKRFKNEANIIASLTDSHIIKIYSFGEWEGMAFMVMEYFEGEPLSSFLEEKPFETEVAVKIVIEVLRGLLAIHRHDIIHRDIKPSNILMSEENEVKIIDFGISKRSLDENLNITKANHLVGTLQYMAPEVLSGEKPTAQSDLFSAGVLLYELLVGSNPYADQNKFATMEKIKTKPLCLPKIAANPFPAKLYLILQKMTAIDPKKRYQKLEAAIKDLSSVGNVVVPGFDNLLKKEKDEVFQENKPPVPNSLTEHWDSIQSIGPFTVPTVQEIKTEHRPNIMFIIAAILFVFLNKNILDFSSLNSEIKDLKKEIAALKNKDNNNGQRAPVSVEKISPLMITGNKITYEVIQKSGKTGKKLGKYSKRLNVLSRKDGEFRVGVQINDKPASESLIYSKNPLTPIKKVHPRHGTNIQMGRMNTLASIFPMEIGKKAHLNYFKLDQRGSFNEHKMDCQVFGQTLMVVLGSEISVFQVSCETTGPNYKESAVYFYSPEYDQIVKSEVATSTQTKSIIEISTLKGIN